MLKRSFPILLFLLIATGVSFLFVGRSHAIENRILFNLWESGHFFLFFIIALFLLHVPWFARKARFKQLVWVLVICLVFALGTEVIQSFVGRSFQLEDAAKDVAGALAACLLAMSTRTILLRVFNGLLATSLLIIAVWPLLVSVWGYYQQVRYLPYLSNAESDNQLAHWWVRHGELSLSSDYVAEGKYAYQVNWQPGQYPAFRYDHLFANWQGYQQFEVSVYNPQNEALMLNYKIFDTQHRRTGQKFGDRFDAKVLLQPGWNHIQVPLSKVQNTPNGRQMNMAEISSVSFFMVNLSKPVTLYFDGLKLGD